MAAGGGAGMTRVAILDYGVGNLHSLTKAIDANVRVADDAADAIRETDVLILPGVGAFAAATARLDGGGRAHIREAIAEGLPVLGICLGMQLLFDGSDEGGGAGLGVIHGRVTALRASRVPQIGWNEIEDARDETARSLTWAYYANGFACRPADPDCVTGWTTHEGDRFPAIVRSGSVTGVQFHPEKSSAQGVRFLNALVAGAEVPR